MSNKTQPVAVSAIIPEVTAKLDSMAAKSKLFADSIRHKFEVMPEAILCGVHPETLRAADWEATLQESHSQEDFRMVYVECPACQEQRLQENTRRRWAKRGVPSRLIDATLESFIVEGRDPSILTARDETQDWIVHAKRNGGFLLLLGNPGLGKGHLAVAALKGFGFGHYITHPDLITELRASYQTHTTEDLLAKYQGTSCLVLDELGVSSGGKDEQPVLYQILAERHDKQLPTVITSNEELSTVKDILGHRIMDRIREDYKLCYFKGKSFRSSKP